MTPTFLRACAALVACSFLGIVLMWTLVRAGVL